MLAWMLSDLLCASLLLQDDERQAQLSKMLLSYRRKRKMKMKKREINYIFYDFFLIN